MPGIAKYAKTSALLFFSLLTITACNRPDVAMMKEGLVQSGMPEDQAACFAEGMSSSVKGKPYNYMATLMKEGADEKDAVDRARRKFGPDFKMPMAQARNACVK